MEERVLLSMLLDLYGELLTEKQKEIMTYYYNDDLSLAEISEITNTSRQAIYDIIKRCQHQLFQHESKLKLLEKYNNDKKVLTDCIDKLNEIKNEVHNEKINICINKVIEDIGRIL